MINYQKTTEKHTSHHPTELFYSAEPSLEHLRKLQTLHPLRAEALVTPPPPWQLWSSGNTNTRWLQAWLHALPRVLQQKHLWWNPDLVMMWEDRFEDKCALLAQCSDVESLGDLAVVASRGVWTVWWPINRGRKNNCVKYPSVCFCQG